MSCSCSVSPRKNASCGKSLNWRERDALQMIDMGNYEAARTLLEDQTWKKEIRQAEEIIEIKKDAILRILSPVRKR